MSKESGFSAPQVEIKNPAETPRRRFSMNDWSQGLKSFDRELARRFEEDREQRIEGLEMLNTLDLPRYRVVSTTIAKFLEAPDVVAEELHNRGDLYYPKVLKLSGERRFELNVHFDELVPFVEKAMSENGYQENDVLLLSEYFLNHYGAHVLIDQDGEIYTEIVRGDVANLTYGKTTPIASYSAAKYTGFYGLKTGVDATGQAPEPQEVAELQEVIKKMITSIPLVPASVPPHVSYTRFQDKSEDEPVLIRHPGYHEVAITRFNPPVTAPEKKMPLEPIFLDWRAPDNYPLPPLS